MKVIIKKENARLIVVAPYSSTLIKKLREWGGRWDDDRRAWTISEGDELRVRQLCLSLFGSDGGQTVPDLVDIAVVWVKDEASRGVLRVSERDIATKSRNGETRLGAGISLEAGELYVDGRDVCADEGTRVCMKDFPRSIAEKLVSSNRSKKYLYEIREKAAPDEVAKLEIQRGQLLTHLAEIDKRIEALRAIAV